MKTFAIILTADNTTFQLGHTYETRSGARKIARGYASMGYSFRIIPVISY
jgi:hypothetical protein